MLQGYLLRIVPSIFLAAESRTEMNRTFYNFLYERSDLKMEELRKINRKLKAKQIGRIVGGIGTVTIGVVLLGKFIYQKRYHRLSNFYKR